MSMSTYQWWLLWTEPRRAVTPVKNQWQCASCLATSATVSLVDVWSIASSSLLPWGEQQLVDFQFINCHVVFIHTTYAQNLSFWLKVNESVELASCGIRSKVKTVRDGDPKTHGEKYPWIGTQGPINRNSQGLGPMKKKKKPRMGPQTCTLRVPFVLVD